MTGDTAGVPREPTADECEAGAQIQLPDGRTGLACWYPQMGGYVGRAVAVGNWNGCCEVWVWHDGSFPFAGHREAAHLHHCDPEQFVAFGRFLSSLGGSREAG